jgi:hypothetical protein
LVRIAIRSIAIGALVATTFAAPGFAAVGAKRSTERACGLVGRFNGRLYDVRETKGNVACRRVRVVVTKFFRTDAIRPAPGWLCFRGHSGVPWAVSCSRGSSVLVRVYPPT